MALPVLLVVDRVTVYTIFTGPSSLPWVMTLRSVSMEPAALSLSVMLAVADAVLMLMAASDALLMVSVAVSVFSKSESSVTGTDSVPIALPSATLMVAAPDTSV